MRKDTVRGVEGEKRKKGERRMRAGRRSMMEKRMGERTRKRRKRGG